MLNYVEDEAPRQWKARWYAEHQQADGCFQAWQRQEAYTVGGPARKHYSQVRILRFHLVPGSAGDFPRIEYLLVWFLLLQIPIFSAFTASILVLSLSL
jgi:hypothetical protein